MRAILVHGFNVTDGGAGSTDKLRDSLEARGYEVIEHDTKWSRSLLFNLLSVRFGNRKRAEVLAQDIKEGDLLIGHSNGCCLIAMACWLLAQLSDTIGVKVVMLNPALDKDAPLSKAISQALVFHTKSDKVVLSSKILLGHKWGECGKVGYHGVSSDRVTNVSYESIGLQGMGHSGVFSTKKSIKSVMDVVFKWANKSR